jgi:hypothetical protein
MYEGRRLLGECRSIETGATYQMIANQAVANAPPADGAAPTAPTPPAPPAR